MTHEIKLISNSDPSELGSVGNACTGLDTQLWIDGKSFNASSITITAQAGTKKVEATVTFEVSKAEIYTEKAETKFRFLPHNNRIPYFIDKEKYEAILDELTW